MIQDLRYGCRMLGRSPGFSILAILCLTLGIGANGAVFSWIEGILLLYRVSPRDPLAFASAFVVIAIAALTACAVPALRATRTDPILALRA